MRVRWVVEDGGRPGGVEAVVRTLASGLRDRGVDSEVLSWLPVPPLLGTPGGALQWMYAKAAVAWKRERAARAFAARIRREIQAHSDLMVILDPGSLAVARHLVGSPRWGLHVHWSPDILLMPWLYLTGDRIPSVLAPLVRSRMRHVGRKNERLLRSAPFLVSLSESHTRTLQRLTPVVHQIVNPVDCRLSEPRETCSDGDAVTVGYVGRLSWEKGPDLLVKALADVDPSGRRVRAVFAGSGPMEGEVRAAARRLALDDIEFMGWVEDPRAVLEQVDVLVLPSRSEAVPLVLVEALAAGCRVVAADAGSGVRDVLRDGLLGEVVPVEDPNALRRGIEAAVLDVRQGRFPDSSAVKALVERHTPEQVLDRWVEFLTEWLGRAPAFRE